VRIKTVHYISRNQADRSNCPFVPAFPVSAIDITVALKVEKTQEGKMNLFPNRNFYPLQCGRDVAL